MAASTTPRAGPCRGKPPRPRPTLPRPRSRWFPIRRTSTRRVAHVVRPSSRLTSPTTPIPMGRPHASPRRRSVSSSRKVSPSSSPSAWPSRTSRSSRPRNTGTFMIRPRSTCPPSRSCLPAPRISSATTTASSRATPTSRTMGRSMTPLLVAYATATTPLSATWTPRSDSFSMRSRRKASPITPSSSCGATMAGSSANTASGTSTPTSNCPPAHRS